MSVNGFGKIHILEQYAMSSVSTICPRNWIFQYDNDPKHRSRIAREWKSDHHVKSMDWPSNSPDLNPIENVWSVFRLRVHNRKPTNVRQSERYIKGEWSGLDNDMPKS